MICGAEVKVGDKAGQERLNTVVGRRQTQVVGSGFAAFSHTKSTELTVRPAGKIWLFQLVFDAVSWYITKSVSQ